MREREKGLYLFQLDTINTVEDANKCAFLTSSSQSRSVSVQRDLAQLANTEVKTHFPHPLL
jgi:hypothetical protein